MNRIKVPFSLDKAPEIFYYVSTGKRARDFKVEMSMHVSAGIVDKYSDLSDENFSDITSLFYNRNKIFNLRDHGKTLVTVPAGNAAVAKQVDNWKNETINAKAESAAVNVKMQKLIADIERVKTLSEAKVKELIEVTEKYNEVKEELEKSKFSMTKLQTVVGEQKTAIALLKAINKIKDHQLNGKK